MQTPERIDVVADVGGTNTRVALSRDGRVDAATIRRFANARHGSLAEVLRQFGTDMGLRRCDSACAAIAGPVRDHVGRLTNLDWSADPELLRGATGASRAAVLNDLVAQGYALDAIPEGEITQVFAGGDPAPDATRLVIGVGTGFNAAAVHETAAGRVVLPSEAGHVTLPVRTEKALSLVRALEGVHGFVGVEDVLSGRGVARIDAWLGQGEPARDTAAIMAALEAGEPRAVEAGRIFVRLLGAVAGDLALIHLPFGGIYLIGGVARAFLPWFDSFGLHEAFREKGRFGPFMGDFGLSVIEDDFAALTGCAAYLTASAR
ncbi:glucokinase [Haematobacter massiliensis]|uniref:Glucokinase n=1 Tax=Haematobacter massiliensis TaxID=195105 RepID=A0A086Y0S2_9RHOB|nr:glucokinase [Haematobacter massiliensis]KFI27872.1 glucokinase [Haematobacter massiliensis]OWJ87177.1 glucokinase [Haematobacter massiliensis]QBJ25173.1 glucokinase [Haematobacter massiliensis]